ncbi:collagen triple helix repeat-containing protein 1-like [Asterias rubens]|uniref:collagen triple helix repeat-containing protein 1-like n=1 Tax=Asterias rubens TaxID=7604 RepID=UPI001454F277|nr:collagen triple helix repeat-containing protein 1-like [Asterias rubens]
MAADYVDSRSKMAVSLLVVLLLAWIPNAKLECVGPKGGVGPAGSKGSVGDSSSSDWYNVSPVRNWRQCVWDISDSTDNGVIYTCPFQKLYATSSLFVAFSGCTRICCCHGCCGRWYFKFNGNECSDPNAIDGAVYLADISGADLHRNRVVQGYCDGLSAGWIDVTLNVGPCSGYGTNDYHTGWNSVSRISIEEIPASPYA